MAIKVKANTTLASRAMTGLGNAKHQIAKASTGRTWIVYLDSNHLTGDMLIAYSDDGGATWTEETVVASARCAAENNDGGLSLMIDSSDVPIIIYNYDPAAGSDEVRYVDRSGGSWNAPETVITANHSNTVGVIDSLDNIHIIYDSGTFQYITGSTGSWSGGEQITATSITHADLAVNSSNEPVMVYRISSSQTGLMIRTGGAWTAYDSDIVNTSDSDGGTQYPMLCIDSVDDYHVCWNGDNLAGSLCVFYRKKASGTWAAQQTIVSSLNDNYLSMLALDSSDNAYIIYQFERLTGQSEAVSYRKVTTGTTMGDVTVLDSSILQPNGESSLLTALYHRYPSSGILSPSVCPAVALLLENGTQADIYYEANVAAGELVGLIAIVETRIHYFDAFGQERYIQGTAV